MLDPYRQYRMPIFNGHDEDSCSYRIPGSRDLTIVSLGEAGRSIIYAVVGLTFAGAEGHAPSYCCVDMEYRAPTQLAVDTITCGLPNAGQGTFGT